MSFEMHFLQIFEAKAAKTRESPGGFRSEKQVSEGEPVELNKKIGQNALKNREIDLLG